MKLFRKTRSLEKKILYKFNDLSLLDNALKHPSFVDRRIDSNQRLEFLGDAVLEIAVSSFLYDNYPGMEEGQLTEHRRRLVQKAYLAERAEEIGLFEYLFLGDAEKLLKGEARIGMLADAYEAVIGAIFVDGGIKAAKNFIWKFHLDDVDNVFENDEYRNYKGEFLEFAQSIGLQPSYSLVKAEGEKHSQIFTCSVSLDGEIIAEGCGTSKKSAEQMAARKALEKILE
ncbi:MAG: ribonuclease III [Candidatus Zixiibacteriota bacterium]